MSKFEKAKEYYYHKEYQKAIGIILELIKNKDGVFCESFDYPIILWYLGDSRMGLYDLTKDKSLVGEEITDYATAANRLLIHHNIKSYELNSKIKKCYELI